MVAEDIVVAEGLVPMVRNFFDEMDSSTLDSEGGSLGLRDSSIQLSTFFCAGSKNGILERSPMRPSHQIHNDRGLKILRSADFRRQVMKQKL